jgi:hypothetical protein
LRQKSQGALPLLTMGVTNMTMTLDRLHDNDPDTITTALAGRLTQRRTGNGGMIASLDDRERTSTKTTICKMGHRRDQSLLLRKNLEGPRTGGRKIEIAIRVVLSAAHIAHIATEMRLRTKQIMTWTITTQSPSQAEMTLRMRTEAAEEIEIEIATETETEITIRADLDDTTKKTTRTRIETGESGRGGSVRMVVMLMKLRRSLDIDHVDISASMGMTTMRSLSMGGKGASGARRLQRQSSESRKRICIRWNEKRGIEKDY